jgi:hypothetical protein
MMQEKCAFNCFKVFFENPNFGGSYLEIGKKVNAGFCFSLSCMRRHIFMGKLNPEKFSQRMQDLNKYLDNIPSERTTLTDRTKKAYGKSLPKDEIKSIMGRAIPPEWTVNLLALGNEPWRFKDLEDQLNMYHKQWQSDQQKQIIAKMA